MALALGVTACGGAAIRAPSPELGEARAAFAQAAACPLAPLARAELGEAERALIEAERLHAEKPGPDARTAAYLARRRAERARLMGLYAADLQALHAARSSARRLRRTVERHAERAHEAAREADRLEAAWEERRASVEEALALALGEAGAVAHDPGSWALYFPAHSLFHEGRPALHRPARARLDALAGTATGAVGCKLVIEVVEARGGPGADAYLLAKRRAQRLVEALAGRGVPADRLEATSRAGAESAVVVRVVAPAPRAATSPQPASPASASTSLRERAD